VPRKTYFKNVLHSPKGTSIKQNNNVREKKKEKKKQNNEVIPTTILNLSFVGCYYIVNVLPIK
jgi:hypothetical protein